MRKFTTVLSIAVFLFFCVSIGARAEHEGGERAERITATELKARIDKGENIVIFDVRAREAHGDTKVKGAVIMPLNELEGRVGEIPFGAMVAAYCT